MPYFYDLNRVTTTNGTPNTETVHLWGVTAANQETVGIYGFYCAARFNTAGGGALRMKECTATIATGGTAQTAKPKNRRGSVAAQSTWKDDTTAITAGGTTNIRISVGFAQTGGMGGYVPIVPTSAFQMMPNGANPIDVEFATAAATASVNVDITVDIGEGI
jgi:hypothetical protein